MTIHWYNFASIKFVCVTSLIIYTIDSIYNKIMLNRHGIFQLLSGWADGPDMITQCPVVPGNRYTHKFNITGQEGTLWWHSHISILRATVYGALIIRPRSGTHGYPFPKPYKEVPIMIGTYSRISKFLCRFKLLPSWSINDLCPRNVTMQASGGMPMLSMWKTRPFSPVAHLISPTHLPSTDSQGISVVARASVSIEFILNSIWWIDGI